ncbi:SMI1/KNR4 family protein [Kribbella sp. NPDC051770]|uniref:SMI1/KNR4 family protein n=1 Tax=Kribbella sp. NPDC051770 TaxID=3155413 RepID=UPI00343B162A
MHEPTWRHLLTADVQLQPPATPAELSAAERDLGTALPPALRELYAVTSGIYDPAGQWFVLWRLADLAPRNLDAWSIETEARRDLLAFGDDGTGDPFCLALTGDPAVHTWSPIDQQAWPLAATLHEFWAGWMTGEIKA